MVHTYIGLDLIGSIGFGMLIPVAEGLISNQRRKVSIDILDGRHRVWSSVSGSQEGEAIESVGIQLCETFID
jgi:hypothetical protein